MTEDDMIHLRTWQEGDLAKLAELWLNYWTDRSLPGFKDCLIDAIAVDDSDKIVGYGQVKLFAEMMLFLDPEARKRDKASALKLLMLEAFRGVDRAGLEQIYCFIKDPDFALLIEKRYDFERIISPGELLLGKR
jgi:hypothetical protein